MTLSGPFPGVAASAAMLNGLRPRSCRRVRQLLHVMAAHSPLSAPLAEEAGFDGIWASGFELSALCGVPDLSFVSMTQHLDMVRAMSGSMHLPIGADIDTGYRNAINVTHVIAEYERAGAAAVVIADKTFPRVSSLASTSRQQLLRIEEFQGKIAALASRQDANFLVIARTEALTAGLGEAEALKRATAYESAGADMILIHSKQKTPDEVESFVRAWRGNAQIVIVPTTYPALNEARISAPGNVKMVIYGNHAIRASVAAMKDVFARIRHDGGIHMVNKDIVSVEEIFRLQGMDRVNIVEKQFLRSSSSDCSGYLGSARRCTIYSTTTMPRLKTAYESASLRLFLHLLRERYPDLSAAQARTAQYVAVLSPKLGRSP